MATAERRIAVLDDSSLVSAIRAADATHGLFADGETVVLGLSGGPDSLALADALRRYADERSLSLYLAHLDHMLRPRSAEDAVQVAQLAARWGVPVSLAARDVGAMARETGRSLEDTARLARYSFLASVALKIGAATVAVAHQADDQAETILMNFLRGSGIDGLKGMTPVAPYPLSAAEIAAALGANAVDALAVRPLRLVRPLLAVPRTMVEEYLAQAGLTPRDDPSNRDARFLRNRVRHEIIPALETVNPRLREALARTAASAADDIALLEAACDAAWQRCAVDLGVVVRFQRHEWDELAAAVQRRLLRRAIARLPVRREYGWEHVEALRLAVAGRPLSGLPGALRLERTETEFWLATGGAELPPLRLGAEPVPLPRTGTLRLPGGWKVTARVHRGSPGESPPTGPWSVAVDAALADRGLAVRGRQPGDRIALLGMAGKHRLVQDLFVDHRVPRAERDGWPLVVAGSEIIWVPGLRLSERLRLPPTVRPLLVLEVEPPARLRPE